MPYTISLSGDRLSNNKTKSKLAKKYSVNTSMKLGGAGLSILSLAACGGGGGGGNPAPTNNTPTNNPPPAPPAPTTSTFTLLSPNTYLASSNLPGTFNQPSSTSNLTVTGRGGNDTITTGSGSDSIIGGGGNDTINSGAGNDAVEGGSGADSMNGGAGADWLLYSQSPSAVSVNLLTGTGSGGDAAGDSFSNFEFVYGSNFNDTLIGDGVTNILEGAAGADTINGGGGFDAVAFYTAPSGVTLDLGAGTGSGGHAAGDTYTNIEAVLGSDFADNITGDGNGNELYGGAGNDIVNGAGGSDRIEGNDGNDTLNGGDGADLIIGGAGNDVINGDADNDLLIGNAGSDTIDGGAGVDTIDYSTSASGIMINLDAGTASGGDAAGDTFSNIENVYGSEQVDTITGDANDNLIDGYGGVDTIVGGAGDDTFLAYQIDASHNDSFDGGDDNDTLAFISSSLSTAYANDLSTVDVTNIENIDLGYLDSFATVESLTLTAQDVLDVTDAGNQLVIMGNAEDSVTSTGQGWVQGADQVIDTQTYNTYTSGAATLLIDEDITQTIT